MGSSPRAAKRPRRRRNASAAPTAAARAACGASPSSLPQRSRAGSSRLLSVARRATPPRRRATPRPPSSPSASALRRSSRRTRPLAPARPAGGRNRRLAADKRLPVRQPSGRARGDRDRARRLRRQLSQADCCQSRRQDAGGHRRTERRAVPLRRPHVRAHRQADRGIPRRSGGVQSGWRDARHRRRRVRALDRRAQPTSGGGCFRLRCRHRSGHSRTTVRDSSSSTARVLAGWASAWITILDSSTLQQVGSIYPEAFEARCPRRSAQCLVSRSQPTAR